MLITQKITLDLMRSGVPPVVNVMQADTNTRTVEASLYSGGVPFSFAEDVDVTISVAYKKPDGTGGWYDVLPDGSTAATITGNVVTAKLAPQVISVPGTVCATLRIENIGETHRVSTFPFVIQVDADPGIGAIKSENYYNVQNWDDVNKNINDLWQSLFEIESNVGIAAKSVLYTAQTLTDDQKNQARENIGAINKDQLDAAVANVGKDVQEQVADKVSDIYAELEIPSAQRQVTQYSGTAGNIMEGISLKKDTEYKFTIVPSQVISDSNCYTRLYTADGVQLWVENLKGKAELVKIYTPTEDVEGAYIQQRYTVAVTHEITCTCETTNKETALDRLSAEVEEVAEQQASTAEELQGIRTGYNGKVYESASEAVRSQIADVNDTFGNIVEMLDMPFHVSGKKSHPNGNIISELSLKSGNPYVFKFTMSEPSGTITIYARLYNSAGAQLFASTLTNKLEQVSNYTPSEDLDGAYVQIYFGGNTATEITCDVTIDGQKDKFEAIEERLSDIEANANYFEANYATKDKARKQFINPSPDDDFCACARGSIMAKEINDNFIANFSKEGDKKDHVATVAIVDDVAYMTYYSNMTNVAETPSEHIARLVYCPLNNPNMMTFIDLQTAGDTYDGKTVTGIYDTVMMRKDDDVLYLMWTASLNGVYHRLYRTFTIATKQLSAIYKNNFYVGTYGGVWNTENMVSALASAGIEHKPISIDIGLMQKLSTRTENGETWYYSGAYANLFNCIVKSKDLVNWYYVSTPTFENDSQYENATYCIGNKVFYFVRQTEDNNTGFLTCYHIDTDIWEDPVFVADCQSRSDFIYTGGNLYLVHAPNDRQHLSLLKINQSRLNKSVEWQTGIVPGGIPYPFCIEHNNEIYIAYSKPYAQITLSKFSIQNMENATIMEKFRTLVTG